MNLKRYEYHVFQLILQRDNQLQTGSFFKSQSNRLSELEGVNSLHLSEDGCPAPLIQQLASEEEDTLFYFMAKSERQRVDRVVTRQVSKFHARIITVD